MQLAYLKTEIRKKDIDDWISQISSKDSFEENIENIEKKFGSTTNDNALMAKYERYEGMCNDSSYEMMPETGELRL